VLHVLYPSHSKLRRSLLSDQHACIYAVADSHCRRNGFSRCEITRHERYRLDCLSFLPFVPSSSLTDCLRAPKHLVIRIYRVQPQLSNGRVSVQDSAAPFVLLRHSQLLRSAFRIFCALVAQSCELRKSQAGSRNDHFLTFTVEYLEEVKSLRAKFPSCIWLCLFLPRSGIGKSPRVYLFLSKPACFLIFLSPSANHLLASTS
jgi:hypothetical protein